LRPYAERLYLPFAAVLLLVGFLGSELVVALGYEIRIDYITIHATAYYGLLPLLVFAAALRIDKGTLRENLMPIAILALSMPVVTCLITGALLYWGIGHPQGFPWQTALVAGAILTATEPFPLLPRLRALTGCRRLAVLLEVEGLINIALAVTLYHIALGLGDDLSLAGPADILLHFIWSVGGGSVLGIVVSMLAVPLSRRLQSTERQALVAVTVAYLAFLAGEAALGVSGIIATLVAGFFFGRATRADFSDEQERFQQQFWDLLSHVAGAVIFLVMGLSFTLGIFQERWLAMLIGIAAVLLVRLPQTLVAALTFRLVPGVAPLSRLEQRFGFGGGIRGAVALALALAVPVDLAAWWTVQAIVFGVVAFSLMLQAPAVGRLSLQLEQPPSR
jgi:CPA1 family monovalent cation:H+ antiporter